MSDSVWPHRWQPTRLPRPWDSPGKNTGVGCHFLLQCVKVKSESEVAQSCPTLPDPHGLQPTRLLHPWDFPGKSTGVVCHCLTVYFLAYSRITWWFPCWLSWERILLQCGRPGLNPWVGKIPWRRERLPTPVFWPGEFHGMYSPWGRKEHDWATFTFRITWHQILVFAACYKHLSLSQFYEIWKISLEKKHGLSTQQHFCHFNRKAWVNSVYLYKILRQFLLFFMLKYLKKFYNECLAFL